MPPGGNPIEEKTLQEVVDEVDRYPIEAFLFVQQGLGYAVNLIHGEPRGEAPLRHGDPVGPVGESADLGTSRHITGPQLCDGLREYAQSQWGMLARVVLARWRIVSTFDFGRIVFALVDAGHMQKTENDTIEDFRNVYDFKTAFDGSYQIGSAK